jgi:hypothetical protein
VVLSSLLGSSGLEAAGDMGGVELTEITDDPRRSSSFLLVLPRPDQYGGALDPSG